MIERQVSVSQDMGWTPAEGYLGVLRELLQPAIDAIKRYHGQSKRVGWMDPDAENQFGVSDEEEQALILMRIMRYMRLPERIERDYIDLLVEETFGIAASRRKHLFSLMDTEPDLRDDGKMPLAFYTMIDARLSNFSPVRMQTTPYGEED